MKINGLVRWLRVFGTIGVTALAVNIYAQTPSPTPEPTPLGGPTSIWTVYDGTTLSKGEFRFASAYLASDVKTERLVSKLMGRDMPYRIVLPASYSAQNSSERFPVVYLLHGLTGHYDNWTDKTKLATLPASRDVIIVTPEGENGWYTDSVARPSDKYESYIIKELIPEIDKKFRTIAGRNHRAIAGLSMGGYGAIKFGVKYPELFVVAGSFSGALGAATITEKQIPGAIGKSIDAIFGSTGSETRASNDLFAVVRGSTPEKIRSLPFLYMDCGTEDFLFKNNQEFATLLLEKKIPHEYRHRPGAHNWKYWDAQVEEFLELADKSFRTAQHPTP